MGPALAVCHRMHCVLGFPVDHRFFKAHFSRGEVETQRRMHFLRVTQQIGSRSGNWKFNTTLPREVFSLSLLKEKHVMCGRSHSDGELEREFWMKKIGNEEGTGEGLTAPEWDHKESRQGSCAVSQMELTAVGVSPHY